MTMKTRTKDKEVTWDTVRKLALSLPGVVEGTSYATTAFKVNGKLIARFHQDGESLAIKAEFATREVLIGANPRTYYITDHYRCWPWMLYAFLMLIQTSYVSFSKMPGGARRANVSWLPGTIATSILQGRNARGFRLRRNLKKTEFRNTKTSL